MTETPKYIVELKHKELELRRYPAMLQAEVTTSGSNYRNAAERGFRVLASYIFGNNRANRNIEMTTPVNAIRSEKIAMTSPVTITGDSEYTVAFIMPASYTMDTLPIPNDQRVNIRSVDQHLTAAIRFNGYFNEEKIRQNRNRLTDWISSIGYSVAGEYIVAGYNPPWVPGFFARNEVMVNVVKQ